MSGGWSHPRLQMRCDVVPHLSCTLLGFRAWRYFGKVSNANISHFSPWPLAEGPERGKIVSPHESHCEITGV